MVTDIIQALTPVILALIAAVVGWQGKQIKELKANQLLLSGKFRSAIRHIRDWHRWEMLPEPRGPSPAIPDDLTDEV